MLLRMLSLYPYKVLLGDKKDAIREGKRTGQFNLTRIGYCSLIYLVFDGDMFIVIDWPSLSLGSVGLTVKMEVISKHLSNTAQCITRVWTEHDLFSCFIP